MSLANFIVSDFAESSELQVSRYLGN